MLKKFILTISLLTVVLIINANFVEAYSLDTSYRPVNSPFNLDYKAKTPTENTVMILQIIAGALLYFATPVAIIMIAFAGFQIVTGGADSDKLDEGKKSITWSLIGLAAIILSYSLIRFVITIIVKSAEAV